MERPKVGIGVLIIAGDTILLGKRKNAHGEGTWAPPGGHLEFGESWEECARREVLEETNIQLQEVNFFAVTNDIFEESQKHYVTVFMSGAYTGGEVKNLEPDKCEEWRWFPIDELPSNLFLAFAHLVQQQDLRRLV